MKLGHHYDLYPDVFDSRSMQYRMNFEFDNILCVVISEVSSGDELVKKLGERVCGSVEISDSWYGEGKEIAANLTCYAREIPSVFVESVFTVRIFVNNDGCQILDVKLTMIDGKDAWALCDDGQLFGYWIDIQCEYDHTIK